MTDLHFRSASTLASELRQGRIGARELLEHFLTRVDRFNPTLNAIIQQDREGARSRADAADAARKRAQALGPLHGVPIIGPAYGDLRTIQLAQRLEQHGFAFVPPPACA